MEKCLLVEGVLDKRRKLDVKKVRWERKIKRQSVKEHRQGRNFENNLRVCKQKPKKYTKKKAQ